MRSRCNILSNSKRKLPISFYHFDANQAVMERGDALGYYLRLTREIVFEEVRKDFFS